MEINDQIAVIDTSYLVSSHRISDWFACQLRFYDSIADQVVFVIKYLSSLSLSLIVLVSGNRCSDHDPYWLIN